MRIQPWPAPSTFASAKGEENATAVFFPAAVRNRRSDTTELPRTGTTSSGSVSLLTIFLPGNGLHEAARTACDVTLCREKRGEPRP
ncbi:hypothetical protein Skr01_56790 [Sphaerisporangium krabiense]|nr:hypothetical protein Skr01_56790 [Sphaerisporangium krabiense]